MRTTVNLDSEAAKAVTDLRRKEGLGLSEAVNQLIRRGLRPTAVDYAFPEVSFEMGARIDIVRTSEVLDLLDAEEGHR